MDEARAVLARLDRIETLQRECAPPRALRDQATAPLRRVEEIPGRKFGDAAAPLLVSVRSGARASMPGMMDTILNLGLNDAIVQGIADLTKNPRFALDAYRRFIVAYADIVLGVPKNRFDAALLAARFEAAKRLGIDGSRLNGA